MKGNYNEECNITACQKPASATWYNHSTRKYYCPSCARRLNSDPFNARDAQKMFGHTLCTLGENISLDDEYYRQEALKLLPELSQVEIKSGREKRRDKRKQQRKNK